MGRTSLTNTEKIAIYCGKYPREFQRREGSLYCNLCKVTVSYDKVTRVNAHRANPTHKRKMEIFQTASISFNRDSRAARFVEAFLKSDIPLHKLRAPALKQLFQEECGESPPSETLCRNAVKDVYDRKLAEIKAEICGKDVAVQCDETEINDLKYVHVLVGEAEKQPYLITSTVIERADAATICRVVDDTLRKLDIGRDNFLHFMTDAAAYMKAAGKTLKTFYPKMQHTTCLAHLAHNVAEQIRARYPEVDSLIASVKAATVKNRRRRADFLAKNIPIPPQPILTRWGTWIDATCYYAENWEVVKEIVENWTGGLLVQRAKEDISQPTVFQNLIELQQYKKLPEYLKLLEHSESTIKLCYDTMKKFLFELDDSDPVKEYLRKRLENCIDLKAIINGTVDTSPAQINKLLNAWGPRPTLNEHLANLRKC